MEKTAVDLLLDLEDDIETLKMVTDTISAIEIAMSEGGSPLGKEALNLPCSYLREVSEKFVNLIKQLK